MDGWMDQNQRLHQEQQPIKNKVKLKNVCFSPENRLNAFRKNSNYENAKKVLVSIYSPSLRERSNHIRIDVVEHQPRGLINSRNRE